MLENQEKLKRLNLPLPNIKSNQKIIIFGTGEIADKYVTDLENKYGDCIECFINGRSNINKIFHNKKVLSLEELQTIEKNKYIYIIASFSSAVSMKNVLLENGILEENIFPPMIRCCVEDLLEKDIEIDNIYIYPVINDIEKLKNIIEIIKKYIPFIETIECKITLLCNIEDFNIINIPKNIVILNSNIQDFNYKNNDIILIWDSDILFNSNISKLNNVYCIDENLIEGVEGKILYGIYKKLYKKDIQEYYNNMSIKNLEELKVLGKIKEKVYIFATGSSLKDWIDKNKTFNFENVLKIVCNGMYISEEYMSLIKPDIYIIYDHLYFTKFIDDRMPYIIDVVKKYNCKLVIPEIYIKLIHKKYNLNDNILIGLNIYSKEICFPNKNNMNIYRTTSVITAFALPIASSISDNIFIIGCDGMNKENGWQHSINLISDDKDYTLEKEKKEAINHDLADYDWYCKDFENLITYGEKQGKKYFTLTKSYIPILLTRYKNI